MKKSSWFYLFAAILLIAAPLAKSVLDICRYELMLPDFTAYCAVSRALLEGHNPFPDHYELLFETISSWGSTVPIVYPGQMLFFALPGFLWGSWLKIAYFALNMAVLFFLTGLTLVKACGYRWRDLLTPGRKQFLYALCCFCFLSSGCVRDGMGAGQIPLILSLCVYGLFWGPNSRVLRTFLFAFVAVAKYSLLPVFAPILFFKGYWKLCIASFCLFLLLSASPVFCGNNLIDVYTGYFDAVARTVQPGGINHYGSYPEMCHLAFFKIAFLNHALTAAAVCLVLWLFWRERGTKEISDTLLLLAFSLTMLISYHRRWDFTLVFPLFFIRLFDFARKKQWRLGAITLLFPLFLVIPSRVSVLIVPSWIGGVIPQAGSVLYLYDNVWETPYTHIFPIMPFFSMALALWSLYLYLHVKEPYLFRIPESSALFRKSDSSSPANDPLKENAI